MLYREICSSTYMLHLLTLNIIMYHVIIVQCQVSLYSNRTLSIATATEGLDL